ncbi:hypothetical protein J2X83_004278 [Brevibacillus nitrificans]|nr:hypothetical protein [Brevibacillus nitrificans]
MENSSPSEIQVQFSEKVFITDSTGFTVLIGGTEATVNAVRNSGTERITLEISKPVLPGEVITIAYNGTGNVVDTAIPPNALSAFEQKTVTNDVLDLTPATANIRSGSTMKTIVIEFDEALSNNTLSISDPKKMFGWVQRDYPGGGGWNLGYYATSMSWDTSIPDHPVLTVLTSMPSNDRLQTCYITFLNGSVKDVGNNVTTRTKTIS